jgi:16S rRNA U516 pseudouridylate synthase RsuA-like enzyme
VTWEAISIYWHFSQADDNFNSKGDFMSTLTITLSEDRFAKLREIAERFNIKPEDLARVSIEELLTRPEESFQQAADYILRKNTELYRRLA